MKILIADIYPNQDYRLIKDTAGGYGTGNDFSNNILGKFLNKFLGSMLDMPPMSAVYVESILEKKNHTVTYYKGKLNFDIIKDYDFYIVQSSIIAFETELKFIKELLLREKKIFVIGVFSNIKKSYYDKRVRIIEGEPELFFLKTDLNTFNFYSDKVVFENFLEDLDSLPFPLWDKYLKKYKLKNNFLCFDSSPAIPLLATRGCPYSCFNYCTYPLQQGRKVRARSVQNIISEIKYWIDNLNINKFVFRDPVFSINRKFTIDLCEQIIKEKIKINFLIETHLNNLDDELISKLKMAGLKMVYVGVESSNENVLKKINRFNVLSDKQHHVIKKLKSHGIITKAMFMIGNPDDTLDSIENTINYAKLLPSDLVQFSVFTPYPGTPIYKLYEDKTLTDKMEDYNQYNLIFKHKNFTPENIKALKLRAYIKVYASLSKVKFVILSFLSFFR